MSRNPSSGSGRASPRRVSSPLIIGVGSESNYVGSDFNAFIDYTKNTVILEEGIELPSLYYAHRREVFERDGMLLAVSPYVTVMDGEEVFEATVRFRTIGDATCTGCVESAARDTEAVVREVAASRLTALMIITELICIPSDTYGSFLRVFPVPLIVNPPLAGR